MISSERLEKELIEEIQGSAPFGIDQEAMLVIHGDKIIYGNSAACRLLTGDESRSISGMFLSLFLQPGDLSVLLEEMACQLRKPGKQLPLHLQIAVDHQFCLPICLRVDLLNLSGQVYFLLTLRRQEKEMQIPEGKNGNNHLAMLGQLAAQILHEVRNPLASIKGFIQLMEHQTGPNQDYLKLVSDEINYMEGLTNDILSFARLDNSSFNTLDLQKIAQESLFLFSNLADDKRIKLELSSDKAAHEVKGNPVQLKQVFNNLIKNAIEATPEKGRITLTLRSLGNMQQVRIKDSGTGIPENVLANLGRPFFTTKSRGTGLGLAISYQIIQAHHGRMTVQSSPNQGTVFMLNFPSAWSEKGADLFF